MPHFADENSGLVPADVATVIHFSQKKPSGISGLRQFAWQSGRTGAIKTGRNCVLQALMWTLVIEDVAKMIEAALLCTKR
jgi:hypothetical protein